MIVAFDSLPFFDICNTNWYTPEGRMDAGIETTALVVVRNSDLRPDNALGELPERTSHENAASPGVEREASRVTPSHFPTVAGAFITGKRTVIIAVSVFVPDDVIVTAGDGDEDGDAGSVMESVCVCGRLTV